MRSAVLAGGAASRFGGQPKGLEKVGGVRMLDRVVQAIRAATGDQPLLVTNAPDAQDWLPGLAVTADVVPDCGSLGGIYTALTAAEGPVLVVAWDMPFVTAALLGALVAGAGDYDVFLPESQGPLQVEPLCGIYGPACTEPVRASLEQKDFRTTAFHKAVKPGTLSLDRVGQFGDPDVLFFNINEPDDLKRAEELWRGSTGKSQ